MTRTIGKAPLLAAVLAGVLLLGSLPAGAAIDGVTGTSFSLTARSGFISTGEGGRYVGWGYALGQRKMQYPGPTLIVNEGDVVTVTLGNELAAPVSIVFPGLANVQATGGVPGLLTREARKGRTVTYTFTATRPGTFLYHSGTDPALQVEMGLVGALIVRPAGYDESTNRIAYDGVPFDHEYLVLLTESDPRIRVKVGQGKGSQADTTDYFPVYWFINGRNAPDTMDDPFVKWLPNQPYNCLPRAHPGDRMLLRIIGGGRDSHPFHTHGSHMRLVARDATVLKTPAATMPDLAREEFTLTVAPGETTDAIYTWTGAGLGWDAYGTGPEYPHDCVDGDVDGFDDTTREYCADHGKVFPVTLPNLLDLTPGPYYSGSPYLGTLGQLPPGEGGFNPTAGYMYMFHSHNEKEITNNDIFVGGMMTMGIIEPPGVPVP